MSSIRKEIKMFTNDEEIILEQYFPYHNMDLEERDYYLNLLLYTKDISDSDILEREDSKSSFEIVTISLNKIQNTITFNGAISNGEENRWIDGIINKYGNVYGVWCNVHRLSDFISEEEKDYKVTDKFTLKSDKLYRKSNYTPGRYFEAEFDAFSLDAIETLKRSKLNLLKEKSKKL